MTITSVGFDADDTLWHNEKHFKLSEERFAALLGDHGDKPTMKARLLDAERRNLATYGFGIKGFTLSMIETALEVTQGRVDPKVIKTLLDMGRDMLAHPIEPLPHARETLATLHGTVRLILITKGDLFDQERKLAQSGLGDFFDAVEIVSDKTPLVYETVFRRHGPGAETAMMIGNSLKSDVIPALAVGAHGVHVPHELLWDLEHAEAPIGHPRYHVVETLADVPALLDRLG
jgi:putative hydrolase of the HAD superfamily